MKGILVPVTGDIRVVEHTGQWHSIAEAIGSQYIERVSLGLPHGHIVMVDEEGMVAGKPINARLSLLYPGVVQGIHLHGDGLIVAEGIVDEGGIDTVEMVDAEACAVTYRQRLDGELERVPEFAAAVAAWNESCRA